MWTGEWISHQQPREKLCTERNDTLSHFTKEKSCRGLNSGTGRETTRDRQHEYH